MTPLQALGIGAPASNAGPYAAAVTEAKKRYPRIANIPMALTYNPQRDRNSETFPPAGEDQNPRPGYWNVEMGKQPYPQHPEAQPELVGLESLHALEDDPDYHKMTTQLINSYTPPQMKRARMLFNKYVAAGEVPNDFQHFLRHVDAPEVVRGRLWGNMFRNVEGSKANPWEGYTPQQINLLDAIQAYLQSYKK